MKANLDTPPAVILHSGTRQDRRWVERFSIALTNLRIPHWTDPAAGEDAEEGLRAALERSLVVVPLVSPDLIADSSLCDLIKQLRSQRGRDLAVRPLLVRPADFDQEIKPINQQALAGLTRPEADRYLAESARRVQEILKSAFRLEIRDLLNQRPRDAAEHFQRVFGRLSQIGPYLGAVLSDVADIAAYLLQELLGSGVRMPCKQDDPAVIDGVVRHLTRLCQEGADLKDESYHQMYTVIRSLQALRAEAPAAPLEPRVGLTAVHGLLPLWIRAAEPSARFDQAWSEACSASLAALSDYLADQEAWRAHEPHPMPLLRIFHCLWFCVHVLKEFPPQAPAVRRDLAHVLREALRFLCFGFEDNEDQRRPYYYFDTGRYAAALCTVVTYHATRMLGEPFAQLVSTFLGTVGSTTGLNHYLPAEHLQHILEIYMAGSFILGVRIEGRSPEKARGGRARNGDPTLAEVLRGDKRGDRVVLECRRAFILAALFHDLGHLVLPRIRLEELGLELPPVRELTANLNAAVGAFAATCADRLAKYADDPQMTEWLSGQRERPDHGMLGAWYLLDVCQDKGLDDWVLRSAVRAVLLHNALTVPVSVDKDPIAALLVLCDELFEWDPGWPTNARAVGKSLQVIAPEVPTHEPRDRLIRVEGIHIDRQLRASLKIAEDQEAWPTIHIELQGPQRLTMPIYRLWFRKSQNLGRIARAACGFGPVLVMTSAFPFEGDTNLAELDALARDLPADLKPVLRSWLDAVRIDARDRQETIYLRSFGDNPGLHAGLSRLLEHIGKRVQRT